MNARIGMRVVAIAVTTGAIGAMLVDCGGGSHAGGPALPPQSATATPGTSTQGHLAATASLRVTVPSRIATTDATTRKLKYVSPNTITLSVSAAPAGHLGTVAATTLVTADISSTSTLCTSVANAANSGRSCTIPVPIPAQFTTTTKGTPSVDLDIATFATPPASLATPVPGSVSQSLANQNPTSLLSEGTLTQLSVVQNTANVTLPVVLSGHVNSVVVRSVDGTGSLYVPATGYYGSLPTPTAIPVAVTAQDVTGSTIIGPFLNTVSVSLGNANQSVQLGVVHSVDATTAPNTTPSPFPTAIATGLANSSDQLVLVTDGKGFLYDPLTISVTGGASTTLSIRADNPAAYNEYDQYDASDNQTLNVGLPQSFTPDTLAADAAGNLYYTFGNGSYTGGVGVYTFTPGTTTGVVTACVFSSTIVPVVMAPQVLANTVWFVDASGELYNEPTTFTGTSSTCQNASPTAQLPLAAGGTEMPVSMTLAYDGSTPEYWIATNAGYLYAYVPSSNTFRLFGNNDGNRHPWIDVNANNSLINTPAITQLSAFDNTGQSTLLPALKTTSGIGIDGSNITQGIVFGDTVNAGLDLAATQPIAPTYSPPPVYAEGTPGPQSFAGGTTAFIDPKGVPAEASQSGGISELQEIAGPLQNAPTSQSNWTTPTSYIPANLQFGPTLVGALNAEGGTAFWGAANGTGVIRYQYGSVKAAIAFSNLPNYSGTPATFTGIVVGGDGRIWMSDNNNHAIYAFPGYGNPNAPGSFNTLSESIKRRPATKH